MKHRITTAALILIGALALTLSGLTGCSSDDEGPTAPGVTPPVDGPKKKVVLMLDGPPRFEPNSVSVAQGDTLVWFNAGNSKHTATSGTAPTADGLFDSGTQDPATWINVGEGYRRVFDDPAGTYPYFCWPHWQLGMTGTVQVQ